MGGDSPFTLRRRRVDQFPGHVQAGGSPERDLPKLAIFTVIIVTGVVAAHQWRNEELAFDIDRDCRSDRSPG